jgi:hypothetical protein
MKGEILDDKPRGRGAESKMFKFIRVVRNRNCTPSGEDRPGASVGAPAECANLDGHRKADMPTKLTPELITAAILGFEEQKRHIGSRISELRAMLPIRSTEAISKSETAPVPPAGQKRLYTVQSFCT